MSRLRVAMSGSILSVIALSENSHSRSDMPLLVVGTHNKKKGQELVVLVSPLGIEVSTLADFPQSIVVVEDGGSFAANANLKAVQQARHLGQWVLSDDSGLSVDALRGAPGVDSAIYAGPQA